MAKKYHSRRARRNPFGLPKVGEVKDDLMDAAAVAGGLIGVPLVLGFVPLPAFARSGVAKYAVQGAAAIAAGVVASMVVGRRFGRLVGVGALSGVVAQGISDFMPRAAAAPAAGVSSDTSTELTVVSGRGLGGYTGYGLSTYTGYPAFT